MALIVGHVMVVTGDGVVFVGFIVGGGRDFSETSVLYVQGGYMRRATRRCRFKDGR